MDYLFLASKFNHYAGPNNHLLDLSNYLYTKSKKSLVLITHSGIGERDFSREIRFPTVKILQRPPRVISNVKAIRHAIRKFSPRRIFVNSDVNLAFQTYFATHARLLIGYNVFLIGAKLSLNRNLIRSVYYNLLTFQDRLGPKILVKKIMAHTDFHRKAYVRVGITPDKITVIPHCVNLDRLHRALKYSRKIEKNAIPTIIFVGRLIQHKGIMELLRVYERITRKTDVHLLIVGSGQLEGRVSEMKRRIEKENSKAHITCVKRVTLSELMCLVNSADIMAIPSYSEPFGIVALEAMGLKKAVLATCFGGISEVITNGVDGILVNPFDSHQLKSSLEELLSDRSERVKLGNAAYQTVKNKYDVSVVAPRFMKFLEESDWPFQS